MTGSIILLQLFNGALPALDLGAGGALLALARGLAVAALLSVFGAAAFRSLVLARIRLPEQDIGPIDRVVVRWAWRGVGVAGVLVLIWVGLQTAAMSNARSIAAAAAALPSVLRDTEYGHLASLQLAGLLATAFALRSFSARSWAATASSGATLALQAGHSHSATMYAGPSLLLAAELAHLLAVGAWIGGLAPLLLVVRHGSAKAGALACRWFSPLGKWCLVVVLATASVQLWELVGSAPGLVGTAYGWVVCVKIALYGALFGFAWVNRYRLAPRLLGPQAEPSRRALIRSIAVQTGVGLATVLAAGLLSQLSPSIHDQPVWPFTMEPSLTAVREDPDLRDEVLHAAWLLAGAIALIGLALVRRARLGRWPALAAAAALIALAAPHLDLLFVPAAPTSFYRSPTGFAAESILAGAALYPAHCASCHGAEGRGDGPLAKTLPVPPADLTAPHLWAHADGELFGWISQGMEAPEGGLSMPGFSAVLTDDDIWGMIDFIRANNAGRTRASTGAWSPPVDAPSFQMTCGEEATDLAALRGRVVRLVFASVAPAPEAGVATVLAGAGARGLCVADDAAIRDAYAVVAGVAAPRLEGGEALIDANGWLRAMRLAGAPSDAAVLAEISATPLRGGGSSAVHHH